MSRNSNNTNIEFVSETLNKNTDNKKLSDWDVINTAPAALNKPSSNATTPLLGGNVEYPLNDLNKFSYYTKESVEDEDKKLNKPSLVDNREIDDFDDNNSNSNNYLKSEDDAEKPGKDKNSEDIDELINDVFDLDHNPDTELTIRAGGVDENDGPTKPQYPSSGIPPLAGFPPSYPGGFPPYVGYPGGVLGDDGMITLPTGEKVPDVNVYQHKKTLAQGMMDLALFSANANQLRYVLESASDHPYFYPGIFMISVSLILQVSNQFVILRKTRFI